MANVVLHDRVKALSSDCWVLPQAARFGSVIVVPGSGNAWGVSIMVCGV